MLFALRSDRIAAAILHASINPWYFEKRTFNDPHGIGGDLTELWHRPIYILRRRDLPCAPGVANSQS
jgi:hypothetical protein